MGFTAIVSGIFSIAKAVPYVYKLIGAISDKYVDMQIAKIDAQRITKNDQRSALLKAIKNAKTNGEILSLSISLSALNK